MPPRSEYVHGCHFTRGIRIDLPSSGRRFALTNAETVGLPTALTCTAPAQKTSITRLLTQVFPSGRRTCTQK